jgi:hypothetical protein
MAPLSSMVGSRMVVDTANTDATLSNVGTIDLNSTSSLEIGSPATATSTTVLLTGGGNINLSGGAIFDDVAFVTVTSDNTISGTGYVDFSAGGESAHGLWINQGIINASTPNGTLTIGHSFIDNSNILEATNGGLLDFIVGAVNNSAQGVVEAKGANSEVVLGPQLGFIDTNAGLMEAIQGGTLVIEASTDGLQNFLNGTNGTIEAGHGSTVALEDTGVAGGFVTILSGGLLKSDLEYSYPYPSSITGAVVTNAGTIGAEGANLTITGDVTNTGTLDANNAILDISGAVSGGKATLEGTGEIVFGGPSSADVRFGASTDAIVKLDSPSTYTGTIFGLTTGTYLDLPNINFADDPTISYSSKNHLLTVTDTVSGVTDNVSMKDASGSFTAQSDGSGGTLITDPPPSNKVAVSNDAFIFASNLGESAGANVNAHHDTLDPPHSEFADFAALLANEHQEGAHLLAHEATDIAHIGAALSAHANHFLV